MKLIKNSELVTQRPIYSGDVGDAPGATDPVDTNHPFATVDTGYGNYTQSLASVVYGGAGYALLAYGLVRFDYSTKKPGRHQAPDALAVVRMLPRSEDYQYPFVSALGPDLPEVVRGRSDNPFVCPKERLSALSGLSMQYFAFGVDPVTRNAYATSAQYAGEAEPKQVIGHVLTPRTTLQGTDEGLTPCDTFDALSWRLSAEQTREVIASSIARLAVEYVQVEDAPAR